MFVLLTFVPFFAFASLLSSAWMGGFGRLDFAPKQQSNVLRKPLCLGFFSDVKAKDKRKYRIKLKRNNI